MPGHKNIFRLMSCQEIRKALEVLETMSFTPDEWEVYYNRLDWAKGKIAGLHKAYAAGKAKGMKKERRIRRKMGVVKSLLADNVPIDKVSKLTGLSKRDIKEIRDGTTNDKGTKRGKL